MNKERSRKNKKWDSEGDLTWKMPSQLGDRWFLKTILLGLLHMLFHIKIKEYCPPTRTFGWILSCKIMNYEAISLELCIHAQDTLTRKACTLVWTSFSSISMLSFLFGGWSIKSNVPILGSATSPLVDLSSLFFSYIFPDRTYVTSEQVTPQEWRWSESYFHEVPILSISKPDFSVRHAFTSIETKWSFKIYLCRKGHQCPLIWT